LFYGSQPYSRDRYKKVILIPYKVYMEWIVDIATYATVGSQYGNNA